MDVPAGVTQRIHDLADNIKKDLELLKEYEDALRDEADPRTRARYGRVIEELQRSAAAYRREYDELAREVPKTGTAPNNLVDAGSAIAELTAKVDSLLAGQEGLRGQLEELPQALLERYDAAERAIVRAVVERLDEGQVATAQLVLAALDAGQVPSAEIESAVTTISEALTELKAQPALLEGRGLTQEALQLSDVIDSPSVDASHKLKLTVPIIPFILSYEGEIGLKASVNLRAAWRGLLSRIRSKE